MAFARFRPTSHFIAPHSWSNDPCGAVYVPETREYLVCYQWNPGTTDGGNRAWGMARSSDLVTWEDCAPALWNETWYDALGVFSGCLVSRLVDGQRVLFLFYTSVSGLPIHWSKPYAPGCETQSVAVSTDFGRTWQRHGSNPLVRTPPKMEATTGWRDPFVSEWASLSRLLGVSPETNYMMIASGERGHGSQIHLYTSNDLLGWEHLSILLDVETGSKISDDSDLAFGMNFECATFMTMGQTDYIIVGVEEDVDSRRHNGHYTVWLAGRLMLRDGKPQFRITSHGLVDHGILYAAHIFRDGRDRLLQLGWADEAAKASVVKGQGWAGCLGHPRELFEISKPIADAAHRTREWQVEEASGCMTTLGIRPAREVATLRRQQTGATLGDFEQLCSANYEVEATFMNLKGSEVLTFNVRQSPNGAEVTKLIVDLKASQITVDRSHSSSANLGTSTPDSGTFKLLPGEDLHVRFFVDASLVEVYANERFALTSRVYPSLDTSVGASYDFGRFDEGNVRFACWEKLQAAWPMRERGVGAGDVRQRERVVVSELPVQAQVCL